MPGIIKLNQSIISGGCRQAVKAAIEVCGQGGLILGSSGEIHPEVRPENAVAFFRAVKKYGRMNSG